MESKAQLLHVTVGAIMLKSKRELVGPLYRGQLTLDIVHTITSMNLVIDGLLMDSSIWPFPHTLYMQPLLL